MAAAYPLYLYRVRERTHASALCESAKVDCIEVPFVSYHIPFALHKLSLRPSTDPLTLLSLVTSVIT